MDIKVNIQAKEVIDDFIKRLHDEVMKLPPKDRDKVISVIIKATGKETQHGMVNQ